MELFVPQEWRWCLSFTCVSFTCGVTLYLRRHIPVFGLGLAAAIAYERTGWLLAPVLAHATYNGVVVLLAGG